MGFSPDDFRRALARSPQAAVTSIAREVLRMSGALMRSPPYFELARRLGLQAARKKALDASITAIAQPAAELDGSASLRPPSSGFHGRQERRSLFETKL